MSAVIITPAAGRDLKDIGRYIARDNADRAISYVRELRAKIAKIGDNPKIYPVRGDFDLGLRSVPYHRYLIFFHIAENEVVEIVRVMHGARDIDSMFE
jgi:toxin ParE1/3/4